MSDINTLSRLISGIVRNVNVQNNTLVVGSLKVGSTSPTELTKAVLDNLITLQNGGDIDPSIHHHDSRYHTKTELQSSSSSSGSDLIGDDDTYSNFSPTTATVKGALEGIDNILASVGDGRLKVSSTDSTKEFLQDKLLAGDGLSSSIVPGVGGSEQYQLNVSVDDSTIEVNGSDQIAIKDNGITNEKISPTAAIALSKLASLSASYALASDASGVITTSSATSAELDHLSGVTSSVQDQLDSKAPSASPTFTGTVTVTGLEGVVKAVAGALSASTITNADIDAAAGIEFSKMEVLTADRIVVTDASGVVTTATATVDEVNYLSGVSSNIQTQLDAKLDLAGGTMTGELDMDGSKIVNVGSPLDAGDAANKAYVDSLISGLTWLNPIDEPDLVDDSLSAPPLSPIEGTAYLVSSGATGAWTGLEGRLVYFDGSSWIDVLGRVVAVGERFGITMIHGAGSEGGSFVGKGNQIAQLTNATPGSYAYTFTVPVQGQAVFVSENGSQHFGKSYVYDETSEWVLFGGPTAINAGVGLQWDGNILNVNLGAGIAELPTDGVGIDLYSASGLFLTEDGSTESLLSAAKLSIKLDGSTLYRSASGLKIADGGVSNTQVAADAAISLSKLASLTADRALVSDASGVISASSITNIELGHLSGVTSAIQTQLNSKAPSASPTFTGTVTVTGLSGVVKASAGVLSASSIVNADIDAAAAIARSKIASGSSNHVVINDSSGALSSEAALSPTRGGTGVSNNAASTITISGAFPLTATLTGSTSLTFPTTGTLATIADVEAGDSSVATAAQAALEAEAEARVNADNLLDARVTTLEDQVKVVDVPFTNNTGSVISAGSVVALSQSVAGEIQLANASALATCEGVIGVAIANIANGATGKIRVAGEITVLVDANLDLGKRAYVSAVNAGQVTKTAPETTDSVVFLVGVASATNKVLLTTQLVAVNG